ncbi:hypothetical protein DH2020_016838 [Rehmannia glutinosa]|uniref:Electron transfer flavoprotein alpha/beta-subunit N-terminal domain-containing protein n=1 Tax=Rehmannia glutinosa TaxID=99300 RepID=A0ABR0WQY5_REHGL
MAIRALLGAFGSRSIATRMASYSRSLSTLVVAEHEGGFVKASSLSAVEAAKYLGEDNSISLLLAGSGRSLQEAAEHAASCHPSISETFVIQVLLADSDKFTYPLAEPWARLVHLMQQKGSYSHIIAGSGSFGKNILPRAAALLDVSPITDIIGISGSNLFVRPIYAGNALNTVRYTGSDPCMLTIRSTSFPFGPVSACSFSNAAFVNKVDLSTFTGRFPSPQDTERPDLGNARVVVTGGRALKSAENFKLIEKLAEKLARQSLYFPSFVEEIWRPHYAVGATRAAVDADLLLMNFRWA